jgi:hypothetical protein
MHQQYSTLVSPLWSVELYCNADLCEVVICMTVMSYVGAVL